MGKKKHPYYYTTSDYSLFYLELSVYIKSQWSYTLLQLVQVRYVQYNVIQRIVATVQNTSGIPPARNAPREPYINWARHGLHTSYYSHHSHPLKINMDQPLEASVPVLPFSMLCSYMYVYRTVGIKVHFVNKWSVSHIRTRTPRLVAHIHVQRTSAFEVQSTSAKSVV